MGNEFLSFLPSGLAEMLGVIGTLGFGYVTLEWVGHILTDEWLVKAVNVDGLSGSQSLDALESLVSRVILIGDDVGDTAVLRFNDGSATDTAIGAGSVEIGGRLLFDRLQAHCGPQEEHSLR